MEAKAERREGMGKRVVLALVLGFAVAQLFRSIRNYARRKDWTDIMGIVASLLIIVGGIGLYIALFYGSQTD